MKITLSALVTAILALSLSANGQSPYVLRLMNGQDLPAVEVNDTSFTELKVRFDKNHFKREALHLKERRKAGEYFNQNINSPAANKVPVVLQESFRPRENVFSIVKPDGEEKLLYYYDEDEGNYLTIEAMRAFRAGQGDAYVTVRGQGWFWTGLGIGAVTGYAARGSMLALAVPPIFALSTKIPTLRIPEQRISDLRYQHNDAYASGYEAYARSRHLRQALKGSAIGTVLGLAAYAIIDNNR